MSIKIHPVVEDKASLKMERHRTASQWPQQDKLPKPPWLKIRVPVGRSVTPVSNILQTHGLVTVCQEASCPNLIECFGQGTATFMIMGDKCTRRCSFCDVAHGRPDPLDATEPLRLARAIAEMKLSYVVITSVDRDDLPDGGASHFAHCIQEVRAHNPGINVEILVPDFRKRQDKALKALESQLPNVFNHNIETIERLYPLIRPGSDYQCSLNLIRAFKEKHPSIPTKSGIMLGLGEHSEEVLKVMHDLKEHGCDGITIGQYLQPSQHHFPVLRYVEPSEFEELKEQAYAMGFNHVASGPFVRSSYHAQDFLT